MNRLEPSGLATPPALYTRWLPLLAIVAVIGYYFAFMFQYALNIPYQDDIYDVLGFLTEVEKAKDWQTALQVFFVRWNEHSTTASRLVYFLAYWVQGEVDFVVLIALSSTSLLVLTVLLYLRLREQDYRWLILLPAVMILFQYRAYYALFWTTAVIAFFYVLVYGFCAIFCLHRAGPVKFLFAVVFATLATYSLASGQLIWVVALASLVHQVFIAKTLPLRYLLGWLVAAAAILALWHTPALSHPDVHFDNLRNMTAAEAEVFYQGVQQATHKPLADALVIQLKFFLTLLGSVASDSNTLVAMCVGAGFLLALLYFSLVAVRGDDMRLEMSWGYIVATVAAIAYGRAEVATTEYALNSRYAIMSIMTLSIAWVLFATRLKLRSLPALYLAAALAAAFMVNSYATYTEHVKYQHDELAKLYNRRVHWFLGIDVKESTRVVDEAVELGIYTGPPRPVPLTDSANRPGREKLKQTWGFVLPEKVERREPLIAAGAAPLNRPAVFQ